MLPAEHSEASRDLQERARLGFGGAGRLDRMIASEMLWGSVAQAIIAVAVARDWPRESHGAFRNAIRLLANQYDDPRLLTFFDSAEKLHQNFYHSNLNAIEVAMRSEQAERLVPRLLSFVA